MHVIFSGWSVPPWDLHISDQKPRLVQPLSFNRKTQGAGVDPVLVNLCLHLGLPSLQKRALKFWVNLGWNLEFSGGKGLGKFGGKLFYLASKALEITGQISRQISETFSKISFKICAFFQTSFISRAMTCYTLLLTSPFATFSSKRHTCIWQSTPRTFSCVP